MPTHQRKTPCKYFTLDAAPTETCQDDAAPDTPPPKTKSNANTSESPLRVTPACAAPGGDNHTR